VGKRFDYIDALRGYAILGVVIVHAGQCVEGLDVEATAWGARGVQLFFVVSALTLMTSWTERNDGAQAFYIRRLFRIAPMFWLAILFYLWLWGMGPSGYAPNGLSAWHVGMTAIFLHGLHPETITSVVPGGWSVADEVLFYAIFPLAAAFLATWLRAAMFTLATTWLAYLFFRTAPGFVPVLFPNEPSELLHTFAFLSFPFQVTAFPAGILAFHSIRFARKRVPPWLIEIVLVATVALLVLHGYKSVHNVPAFGLLFAAVATTMGLGAGGYLVNPVIRHIGKVSFSAYLIHFSLLGPVTAFAHSLGVRGPWGLAVILPALVVATTTIATATFLLIEQPAISFGRRVVAWRRFALPPETASSAHDLQSGFGIREGSDPQVGLVSVRTAPPGLGINQIT
jgi:peptidoglycan/LPS O-acetylase OafA/YrhL